MEPKEEVRKRSSKQSPSHPARDLESCFNDTRVVFEQYGSDASFREAEIASTLGVQAGTGSFRRRIAALKHFGLIDGGAGQFSATDLFERMYRAERGTSDFETAAYEAAVCPRAFSDILASLGNHLPKDDALHKRLMLDHGFSSPGAKTAATVLRKSLSFAGALDHSGNIIPPKQAPGTRPPGSTGSSAEPPRSGSGPQFQGPETEHVPPTHGGDLLQIQLPLSGGRSVTASYPTDLSPGEAATVGAVLKGMFDALAAVPAEATPSPHEAPAPTPLGL